MTENRLKTALITGGAQRIGRAIALSLAETGWNIVLQYNHSADEAEKTVAELKAHGCNAAAISASLEEDDAAVTLFDQAVDALGPVTCLVNNAAIFEPDTIETLTSESWAQHIEVNLHAPLVLSRKFAAALPDNESGNIVNIIDQRVLNPTPWFLSYSISKAGLLAQTEILARALAPRIRVNGIGPGPTLPSPRQDPEQFEKQKSATPLGQGATPEEIGAAVCFLLASPSITGQMLALDGGQHLGWDYPANPECPKE